MKNRLLTSLSLMLILNSCYKEDDYSPTELSNIMNLRIDNDNQLADGLSKITAVAEFPSDFSTETNNKVTFIIAGIEKEADIRLVEIDGTNKKIAEIDFTSKSVKTSNLKAIISVLQSEISEEQNMSFRRAFCESINLSSSSLTIIPDSSFTKITLTTKLIRESGVVSIGTIANTKVVDLNGVERGILVNYSFKTDSLGIITNQFTMGNDGYEGQLYAISESLDESNNIKKDTLILYSQN
ncbi:hypothetical protein [Gillisia limnaea]|uniref:Uncharacterized protein n=1 Tax=Gillisia limnaea (strain DSM 15749 / LMG 21470 / R-8282) TaxID=865937 RepID=H2BXG8_GILLR|nr:hypothetical protein [Gillisia limnaea]EHQ02050.1 hypothetical protein Gilli_1391 [Gillisia limnaea DSM 15749]